MIDKKTARTRVHVFCAMVKKEMELRAESLCSVLLYMADSLSRDSLAYSEVHGVKPVEHTGTEMFRPFIFDRMHIPEELWHWFYSRYSRFIESGCLDLSRDSVMDIYLQIRADFDQGDRVDKIDKRDDEQIKKCRRRELSKLVRDGQYNYTIQARDRSFKDLFTKSELKKAAIIFDMLFAKQITEYRRKEEDREAIFLLGVRQGMYTAKSQSIGKNADVCDFDIEDTRLVILRLCADLTPRERSLVLIFIQSLKKRRTQNKKGRQLGRADEPSQSPAATALPEGEPEHSYILA